MSVNSRHRAARRRLTLLYGGLFLLSGAALMLIAYLLLVNAGFVFNLPGNQTIKQGPLPGRVAGGLPLPGTRTHPSAATMAHWQGVAGCMHAHGFARFPEPKTSVSTPINGVISDRDGAILAVPSTLNTASSAFIQAATTCGYMDGTDLAAASAGRSQTRTQLLIQSGIALLGMSVLSLGLGWWMAGRVLRPLEESYEAQRQFVANASHELRAPLTRQRALIQVALGDPDASFESLQAAHERVLASEQHLEQLIEGLLTLSRGQAGLERSESLDLAVLVRDGVAAREPDLTGLEVRAVLGGAPTVGDPRLLERLIANVLDNAIRHNVAGGRIEITTGIRDKRALVSIANTGAVVPEEQLERLFQPFERLVSRTQTGGHGLGLAIVQAIADAHRAQIDARARPEGGLVIEIAFPVIEIAFPADQLVPSESTLLGSEPEYLTLWPKGFERSTTTQ